MFAAVLMKHFLYFETDPRHHLLRISCEKLSQNSSSGRVFQDSWTSTALQTIGQNLSSYTEYQQQRRYCFADCFFPFVALAAILGTHAGLTTVINTICMVGFFSGLQQEVNRDMNCLCGQCKASVTSKHPLLCFSTVSTVRRYILQTWKVLRC